MGSEGEKERKKREEEKKREQETESTGRKERKSVCCPWIDTIQQPVVVSVFQGGWALLGKASAKQKKKEGSHPCPFLAWPPMHFRLGVFWEGTPSVVFLC